MKVRGTNLKDNEYDNHNAKDFIIGDLRDYGVCESLFHIETGEVYQLEADIKGTGYISHAWCCGNA